MSHTVQLRRFWVFAVLLLCGGMLGSRPLAAQPATPVEVAPVVVRSLAAGQTSIGTVMPSKHAVIGSAVDGRVIEFPVNQGDRVASGQALAQLLTQTISLELTAAEAELQLRKEELDELVNGTRPEEIEQARAKMLAAQARNRYWQTRLKRTEALFNSGRAATAEDLDAAMASADEAEQTLHDATLAYQLAVEGPRAEKKAQAQARVAMQQALVDKLRDQIRKHTIIARFDGYVTAEHTEVGAWVQRGSPVAEIAALDQVEVEIQVVEQHVPFVRIGAAVRVEIPSLPQHLFTGQITHVVPQADLQARTFPVTVRVPNLIEQDQPLIKAGMYARVTLPVGQQQEALLVPKDAIVLGGAQPTVFVVKAGDASASGQTARVVQPVPVQLGVAHSGWIQVEGTLQADDLVVVLGNERLRPNQAVQIIKTVSAQPPEAESGVGEADETAPNR